MGDRDDEYDRRRRDKFRGERSESVELENLDEEKKEETLEECDSLIFNVLTLLNNSKWLEPLWNLDEESLGIHKGGLEINHVMNIENPIVEEKGTVQQVGMKPHRLLKEWDLTGKLACIVTCIEVW